METSPQIPAAAPPSPADPWARAERVCVWGLLVVALFTMTFIRLRLLDFPLERDEGEYAYAGQLILQGVPPYQECYNMKWPGTYVAYAAIMAVFGETPAGIHLGLLFVSLASAGLVFLIGRRVGGLRMGAVAGATEALLAVNPSLDGLAGHATHFVVLPALAGIWLLTAPWEQLRWRRCFAAGFFFGLACIMKQPGAVFGLFAALWLLWRGWAGERLRGREIWPRVGFLVAGGILALLLMAGWLAAAGVYEKFWHWTVDYARAYLGVSTFSAGLDNLTHTLGPMLAAALWLWLLAALGMALLWFEPALRRWRVFLAGFTAFSLAGVCPGFYFRPHYFLLLTPAASLLCGAAWCAWQSACARSLSTVARETGLGRPAIFDWIKTTHFALTARAVFAGLFLLAAGHVLLASRRVFFFLSPEAACREVYSANPFPEAQEIARHIAAGCPPEARIAVLGSEPEIYFYSQRRAATGYIYTYPLMEPQPFALDMQRDMIREIEHAVPEYLVFVSIPDSWARRDDSHTLIFQWMKTYCTAQMELEGRIEILPDFSAESHWGAAALAPPRSNYSISVYRRKAGPAPVSIRPGTAF